MLIYSTDEEIENQRNMWVFNIAELIKTQTSDFRVGARAISPET